MTVSCEEKIKKNSLTRESIFEIFRDMLFINKLYYIQNGIRDKYLCEQYTKLIVSYLAIVLHECIQVGFIKKCDLDKGVLKILRTIRQRTIKLIPKKSSESICKIIDTMGIDFKHYCFDIQILMNKMRKDEIISINFTYYDLLCDAVMKYFNALVSIPINIVRICSRIIDPENYKQWPINEEDDIFIEYKDSISKRINLKNYPFASAVCFCDHTILDEEKLMILYYYTMVKHSMMIETLVPDYTMEDTLTSTIRSKTKFRAIIIENLGMYLKDAKTSIAEELRIGIGKIITDINFFSRNRALKNNIHYSKIDFFPFEDILQIYNQQQLYLETILKIFDSKLNIKIDWKYKFIRFIADRTDSTMIALRKKNKNYKRWEDVPEEEWEQVKKGLKRKIPD
jgi:hypothetical protein